MKRLPATVTLAASVAALLAACGGGSSATTTSATTQAVTTSAAASSTTSGATPTDSASDTASSASSASSAAVSSSATTATGASTPSGTPAPAGARLSLDQGGALPKTVGDWKATGTDANGQVTYTDGARTLTAQLNPTSSYEITSGTVPTPKTPAGTGVCGGSAGMVSCALASGAAGSVSIWTQDAKVTAADAATFANALTAQVGTDKSAGAGVGSAAASSAAAGPAVGAGKALKHGTLPKTLDGWTQSGAPSATTTMYQKGSNFITVGFYELDYQERVARITSQKTAGGTGFCGLTKTGIDVECHLKAEGGEVAIMGTAGELGVAEAATIANELATSLGVQ